MAGDRGTTSSRTPPRTNRFFLKLSILFIGVYRNQSISMLRTIIIDTSFHMLCTFFFFTLHYPKPMYSSPSLIMLAALPSFTSSPNHYKQTFHLLSIKPPHAYNPPSHSVSPLITQSPITNHSTFSSPLSSLHSQINEPTKLYLENPNHNHLYKSPPHHHPHPHQSHILWGI